MRGYEMPERTRGESNAEYCRRAVESMPTEAFVVKMVTAMVWEVGWDKAVEWMMEMTGYNNDVSSAIVERFFAATG